MHLKCGEAMNVVSNGAHFIAVGNVIVKLFKLWCHKLVSIVFC